MSKKLWSVQAVSREAFNNRPPKQAGMLQRSQLRIPAAHQATVMHPSIEAAIAESERLAQQFPHMVFLVMEAVHVSYTQNLISQPLEHY